MPEPTTPATSSPAEMQDPFNGVEPTHAEFSKWRETGEVAERFKSAEPAGTAPADDQEQTDSEVKTESAGESETPNPEANQEQSRKPKNAAQRIAQLEAAIEAEWDKDAPDVVRIGQLNATIDKINGRPKRKTETATPEPAKTEPTQNQPQYTRPKPKPDGMNQAGKPYETYEDYVEDLADWSGEQKVAQFQRQQAEQRLQADLQAKLEDVRSRYPDADEVIFPTERALAGAKIPQSVQETLGYSKFYPELLYVMGTDPDGVQKFITLATSDPREANARLFEWERGIKEALAKNGNAATAPEKKKTQAPPPPTPVSRSSGRAFDVNDDSISDDEWMRKRRAQVSAK